MRTEKISWIILFSIFMILVFNTFKLQVINGKEQYLRASQNRFRIKTIEAKRGIFFDRKGEELVRENGKRNYVLGEAGAHVLGYVGEANEEELSLFGVEMGRAVGKMGLEREENSFLQGIDGGTVEECTAIGEKVRTFSQREPINGGNIQLTLDKNLQEIAYQKLKESSFSGAVIAGTIDGEILAMVSNPSFDPNQFVELMTYDDEEANQYVEKVIEDEDYPLFNRAISGVYPPASTFKIITAIASLEEKIIDRNYEVEDTGQISVGGSTFSNWYFGSYGKTDGMVNVVKALQRSNDIFFYKVGEELGIEKLAIWAKNFGLGQKTGIKLNVEAEGLVPNKSWKKETLDEDWYLGDTYITSIGQGNLQATPIQIQMMMSTIANDGYLCRPELVSNRESSRNGRVAAYTNKNQIYELKKINSNIKNCRKLDIKSRNLDLVKEGLEKACETGGTGWPLFNFQIQNPRQKLSHLGGQAKIKTEEDPTSLKLRGTSGENYLESSESADLVRIPVACKTGTAETGRNVTENGKEMQKTHAWFTAYAPSKNPEIVVTVFMEDAGGGSDIAAPIAREVLRKWFENRN